MPADRTAEDWGRVAVGLPGWHWLEGMLAGGPLGPRGGRKRALITGTLGEDDAPRVVDFRGRRVPAWYALACEEDEVVVVPDHHPTAGCLLALLGGAINGTTCGLGDDWTVVYRDGTGALQARTGPTLGRACIAVAEALGRWPGGILGA